MRLNNPTSLRKTHYEDVKKYQNIRVSSSQKMGQNHPMVPPLDHFQGKNENVSSFARTTSASRGSFFAKLITFEQRSGQNFFSYPHTIFLPLPHQKKWSKGGTIGWFCPIFSLEESPKFCFFFYQTLKVGFLINSDNNNSIKNNNNNIPAITYLIVYQTLKSGFWDLH